MGSYGGVMGELWGSYGVPMEEGLFEPIAVS
jgi:hypothetical protein